jgi:DNA-binding NarL/FixJ family response regulator
VSERRAAVLVIDADKQFRTGLTRVLHRAGLAVVEAASGEEGLQAAESDTPAAVILEVSLPDIDGLEVCRALRDRFGQNLPLVVVAGTRVEAHDRIAAFLIGADDYLVKPVDPAELMIRLRRLLERARESGRNTRRNGTAGLTVRESEILGLLARGMDAAEIARELVISPKTVSSHLQRVMAKLGVHSRAQAVAEAYRLGLVNSTDFEAHALLREPETVDKAAPEVLLDVSVEQVADADLLGHQAAKPLRRVRHVRAAELQPGGVRDDVGP